MTMIEVFADVWCPFTHVGLRRWLERRAAAGRDDVRIRVRAWPLELVNGEPLPADLVGHEVGDLRAQVAPDLFAGFPPRRFPTTTLPALRLTDHAYRVDDAVGERIALELRDRLFERGEDVSDPALLAEVADAHGVPLPGAEDDEGVLADLAEGRRRGVVGSPHFFGPGIDVFCPGLQIEHEGEHLRIEPSEQRFEDLCDASFGASR